MAVELGSVFVVDNIASWVRDFVRGVEQCEQIWLVQALHASRGGLFVSAELQDVAESAGESFRTDSNGRDRSTAICVDCGKVIHVICRHQQCDGCHVNMSVKMCLYVQAEMLWLLEKAASTVL